MEFCNIIIPRESAQLITHSLGAQGQCQFIDKNASDAVFKRQFSAQHRQCEEILRRCRQVEGLIEDFNLKQEKKMEIETIDRAQPVHKSIREIDRLQEEYGQREKMLEKQMQAYEELKDAWIDAKEQQAVYTTMHTHVLRKEGMDDQHSSLLNEDSIRFRNVIGVIRRADMLKFRKAIHRVSRGNVAIMTQDFMQRDKQQEDKQIFLLIQRGVQGGALDQKLTRTCNSFDANRYNIPSQEREQKKLEIDIDEDVKNKYNLQEHTRLVIVSELKECAMLFEENTSRLAVDMAFVTREKSVQTTMNLYKSIHSTFQANCWVPQKFLADTTSLVQMHNQNERIRETFVCGQLYNVSQGLEEHIKLRAEPPSLFECNEFMQASQSMVDTQGVPRQGEVNPSLFNAITFPFQFGVMFGDIGHGSILLCFAIALCYFEPALKKLGMVDQLLFGRQQLLLMGFFAFFMGFVQNEFMGIGIDWGTCQAPLENAKWSKRADCTNQFGMDVIWLSSSNDIQMANSFKMKMAIVLGVVQMLFGVFLKGCNTFFYRTSVDFFCEFIPQFLFLLCTFGWLVVMIFIKWATPYEDPATAPSLINTMIQWIDPKVPLWGTGDEQRQLQQLLAAVATVCIPLMLLIKPYTASRKSSPTAFGKLMRMDQEFHDLFKEKHPHGFGELMVHQMIETIEQVLGCVSNTASYLRLWALSLAHSQLAIVFFGKIMLPTVKVGNFVAAMIGFVIFIHVTIAVLLIMDSMECGLHALRLHWVEFHNKFYSADGNKFNPYSHRTVLKDMLDI